MIIIPRLKIGYQNIPKVATTSLFQWLYTSCEGEDGATGSGERGKKDRLRNYFKGESEDAFSTHNSTDENESFGSYYRFAITRDPVKRFLSMYSNRIVHYRELSMRARCADKLHKVGLKYDPQVNELIERLDDYHACAKVIKHHSMPMMEFMGPDISVYSRITDISNVGDVVDEIKDFWAKNGMQDALMRAPNSLERKQTGGPKLGLGVLSESSFERLLDYYKYDYEQIPTVSLDGIKEEYHAARKTSSKHENITFAALDAPKKKRKALKKLPENYRVIKEDCPLVEKVQIKLLNDDDNRSGISGLRGVVLLKSDVSDDWALSLDCGDSVYTLNWGLASPKISDAFPDNPYSGHARFNSKKCELVVSNEMKVFIDNGQGDRHLVFTLQRQQQIYSKVSSMRSPYQSLPPSSFWRSGVVDQKIDAISGLYKKKFDIDNKSKIAAAGSCFAQHITKHLRHREFNVLDYEPAPMMLSEESAKKYGYNLYSARYGNIYHVRQLLQLAKEATGGDFSDLVWEKDQMYYDALRPSVEKLGLESSAHVIEHRKAHLKAVRRLLLNMDVFIFTLGLTESWVHTKTGRVLPTAPGTIAGDYDPSDYHFVNFSFNEIYQDFLKFRKIVRRKNPNVKFLLTVSPVPLTATAEQQHVLCATTYSKSVLRAVAGALEKEFEDIDYFPSYEIIATQISRGEFYESNLRSVKQEGVDTVMKIFFEQHDDVEALSHSNAYETEDKKNKRGKAHKKTAKDDDLVCEDELLEAFEKCPE